ncbi:hypothetical protein BKA70DRAFT_1563738 [Coprinopsis sp. MPI-PUGE-AT-0042]|nr:hypothetical protein BKA70DRAFT_1563738 [Coprinopsis sp. MPI-PUGE-AT-0042]
MGSSVSTTASVEVGPGLTLDERTPSDEIWLKELSDRTNTSRQTIVAILCPAVFASTTMDKAFDDLPQKLLEACDSKTGRRKQMLQTPFVDGQAPIAWAICNLPDSLLSAGTLERLPPIISALLDCCGEQTPSLMDAVYSACCIRNTNSLFQLINPYPKSNWSDTPAYSIKPARSYGVTALNEFQFSINDFPTRMLVEGRIDMRFIHGSRLYSVGFSSSTTGEWMFFYRIVLDHGDAKDYWKTINLDLFSQGAIIDDEDTRGMPGRMAGQHRSSYTTKGVLTATLRGSAYYDSTERTASATLLKNAYVRLGFLLPIYFNCKADA